MHKGDFNIVYILIEGFFFLLSFSALPVSVIYFARSRDSWIVPYLGIQCTAAVYAVLDVLYNGALFAYQGTVSAACFPVCQTLLRGVLLILVPAFLNHLFILPDARKRMLVFSIPGVILILWSLVSIINGSQPGHESFIYLSGSAMSILIAVYVFVIALRIHPRLHPPMSTTNNLFLFAGPVYITYLIIYTASPLISGRVFRTGPVSFTNCAYGIWNVIFLCFLIHFITEKHSEADTSHSLSEFLETFDFTDREKEILALVIDGLGNKQIAAELHINENTVKAHLYNAYSKIGIHTRVELMKAVFSSESL